TPPPVARSLVGYSSTLYGGSIEIIPLKPTSSITVNTLKRVWLYSAPLLMVVKAASTKDVPMANKTSVRLLLQNPYSQETTTQPGTAINADFASNRFAIFPS